MLRFLIAFILFTIIYDLCDSSDHSKFGDFK